MLNEREKQSEDIEKVFNTSNGRHSINRVLLVVQTVKNLPAMWETQVQSLGQSPGEGNGNQLQYACLGNPMDRGPW